MVIAENLYSARLFSFSDKPGSAGSLSTHLYHDIRAGKAIKVIWTVCWHGKEVFLSVLSQNMVILT